MSHSVGDEGLTCALEGQFLSVNLDTVQKKTHGNI